MKLRIQDPTRPGSTYLLDEILEACDSADEGGGVFAFASQNGINLLLKRDEFRSFLGRAKFRLIVGVDAVTDTKALDLLRTATESFPNLSVSVYLDEGECSIFHPKMCWFGSAGEGRWIVGSGNLTAGGLRWNVEAFTLSDTNSSEHHRLVTDWQNWLSLADKRIRPVDDPEVFERAKLNGGRELTEEKVKPLKQDRLVEDELGRVILPPPDKEETPVLIAEIPKGGRSKNGSTKGRWSQANFDISNYREFFGYDEQRRQQVLLTYIDPDGSYVDEGTRPFVPVKSDNYRIELGAAKGKEYPDNPSRPIGIFARLGTLSFRYILLMPSDRGYDLVRNHLIETTTVPEKNMRRRRTDVAELSGLWPDCPLLR